MHNACMINISGLPGSLCQCIGHSQIRNCRIFNRRIFPACPFHTHRTCSDHNITAFYFRLHTSASTNPHKGICPTSVQFFHSNGCRWTTDPSGCYTDFFSFQRSCVCYKFSVVSNPYRILKILCDLFTSARISWQDHIFSHFPRCYLNMIQPVIF